jgi:hypothetical protein
LIGDGRAGGDNESVIEAVLQLALKAAPDVMDAKLLEQIQFENSGEQKFLFCSLMVDRAWSEGLGIALLRQLRENLFVAPIQGVLLSKLIRQNVVGAKEWAEETVRAEYKSECTRRSKNRPPSTACRAASLSILVRWTRLRRGGARKAHEGKGVCWQGKA